MTGIRHFTASGIVLDHANRVLLVKHTKLGMWLYPGGHVDPDEDPVQALHREIREETGLQVEIIAAGEFDHPAVTVLPPPFTILVEDIDDTKTGPHQHIDLVYICRPVTGEVVHQADELDGHAWVPLADIAALPTPAELPALVAEAVKYARSLADA
ncbi:MAG: NUDIX domain-containing protein [Sporichthyaceae bacterium]|nr:NUDIX domain-containing protein [Sporichthyaceae bacterium]